MKLARFICMLALAIGALLPITGCGVGTTEMENRRTLTRVADYDARELVDDIALFAQTNRPLRTSRWVID